MIGSLTRPFTHFHTQVSDQSLTTFASHESGSTVAIGTADGGVTILQLSGGLYEMAPNEKAAINGMFERETTREKNLDKAMKEAKVWTGEGGRGRRGGRAVRRGCEGTGNFTLCDPCVLFIQAARPCSL